MTPQQTPSKYVTTPPFLVFAQEFSTEKTNQEIIENVSKPTDNHSNEAKIYVEGAEAIEPGDDDQEYDDIILKTPFKSIDQRFKEFDDFTVNILHENNGADGANNVNHDDTLSELNLANYNQSDKAEVVDHTFSIEEINLENQDEHTSPEPESLTLKSSGSLDDFATLDSELDQSSRYPKAINDNIHNRVDRFDEFDSFSFVDNPDTFILNSTSFSQFQDLHNSFHHQIDHHKPDANNYDHIEDKNESYQTATISYQIPAPYDTPPADKSHQNNFLEASHDDTKPHIG